MRHINQNTIEGFISDQLDENQLSQVLDHLDECEACYDETEVYYMITTGLLNQDANLGAGADLRRGFREFVEQKKKDVVRERRRKDRNSYALTALIIIGLVLLYYWVA